MLGQGFITNWGSFALLQIGAAQLLQNGADDITNWGSYYKLVQPFLKTGANFITNQGGYYKLGQLLQMGA